MIGQHRLTGKECQPLNSPIRSLSLCDSLGKPAAATTQIRKRNRKLIQQAELICYPPGSFYSSLLANLLPEGVGRAIARNRCPKVYIPNQGTDPEQLGMTLEDTIDKLLEQLQRDGEDLKPEELDLQG